MEAPGTAPGSEWFISMFVYRHSRRERRPFEYKRGRVFVEGLSREWVRAVDKILVLQCFAGINYFSLADFKMS